MFATSSSENKLKYVQRTQKYHNTNHMYVKQYYLLTSSLPSKGHRKALYLKLVANMANI